MLDLMQALYPIISVSSQSLLQHWLALRRPTLSTCVEFSSIIVEIDEVPESSGLFIPRDN